MNNPILTLQCPPHERDKPTQRKALGIQPAPTTSWHLCEVPTQHQPHVQQNETQPHQHKPIRRIPRRRPSSHLPRTSVAAFHPKAPPILPPNPLRWHLDPNQNEEQPCRSALQSLGALGS